MPIRVKATREGLLGKPTASGYLIDLFVPFVALPDKRAVGRCVQVTNPKNGLTCQAIVLDVGPWNTADHAYVFGGERPQSETGMDTRGRKTNKAGIDLSEKVWRTLDMKGNTDVIWEFLTRSPVSDAD